MVSRNINNGGGAKLNLASLPAPPMLFIQKYRELQQQQQQHSNQNYQGESGSIFNPKGDKSSATISHSFNYGRQKKCESFSFDSKKHTSPSILGCAEHYSPPSLKYSTSPMSQEKHQHFYKKAGYLKSRNQSDSLHREEQHNKSNSSGGIWNWNAQPSLAKAYIRNGEKGMENPYESYKNTATIDF